MQPVIYPVSNFVFSFQDLVKSHLMNAVRSEVEELKEKIIKLEDIITQLQTENEFLRANVNRDVLMKLQQQQQLQMQQQQALPSPPSQPALPPAQQPSI
jgi:regulator of replication initiation timing